MSSNNPTWKRYVVLTFLCTAATIAYMGRNCLGVASDDVEKDLKIEVMAMSAVLSAFFWGYALFQVPSGWLVHIWEPRRALWIFALAWSVACVCVGFSIGLLSLMVTLFVFGMAQAGIFLPAAATVVSRWMPDSRRALATGSLGSFMSIGAGIGVALTGLLVADLGWRSVLVVFAVPGFIWASAFFWWFRDRPEDHPSVNDAELKVIGKPKETAKSTDRPTTPWLLIFTNFDIWMICGQQFFRAAGYIFYSTWFPAYLRETFGVSVKESGLLTSLPLLAAVVGSFTGGVIVDWIWNATGSRRLSRQGVGIFAMLSCALFIGLAFQIEDAVPAVLLISAGSFCGTMAGPCAYTVTIDKSGGVVAPVFGLMNMSGNIGAATCPLIVGWFVMLTGGAWHLVLLLFVGNYVLAAICWALINPNGTIMDKVSVVAAKEDQS